MFQGQYENLWATSLIFEEIILIEALPKVAVVILNWNGCHYLQQFLPSVLNSTYANKEVIVADNASTDGSAAWLQQNFPGVKIIALKKNHGFARGYNEALAHVQSEYYVLLNSDVEVAPGWIEPVVELMASDKTIGAAQPKILSYFDKHIFEYAGAAGGWIDYLGYPFARGRVFSNCEKDVGQYDDNAVVFWASGAALFVKAELFHRLNGFDNYFFAHMEEIDFCWRLQLAGHRVCACPKSVVYHLGAGTLQKESPKKIFLNFRNNLIMLAKNLPFAQAVWKIPFRLLLDGAAALQLLSSKKGVACFVAVIKAHWAFLYWLLFRQKESVFPFEKKRAPNGWAKQSIVWQHYVKGKKTFAEIVKNKT
ncbi:MAG: glycosyltransferase family 2 protein [Bacteroidetes bacterium]|nr:glycosyltransferase family 2 protein [Bacteroidota bacterium]MBS1974726.1 glycosyltransferase family 2 protein [Bacteroidota bacterium]